MVTCYSLRIYGSISDNRNLIIKRHDADLPLIGPFCHFLYLRFNCCLHALNSRHVCFLFIFCIQKLIGTVSELSELFVHFCDSVTLELVFAFNSLGDAHWTRNINAEYDRDVLSSKFSILHLSSCFNQVSDLIGFRNFFVINHDFVSRVAEFTCPNLLVILHTQLTDLAKHTSAWFAKFCVSSGHLFLVFEAVKSDLEYICVKFLLKFLSFFLFRSWHQSFALAFFFSLITSHGFEDGSTLCTVLIIWTAIVSCHVIRVNLLCREILIDVLILFLHNCLVLFLCTETKCWCKWTEKSLISFLWFLLLNAVRHCCVLVCSRLLLSLRQLLNLQLRLFGISWLFWLLLRWGLKFLFHFFVFLEFLCALYLCLFNTLCFALLSQVGVLLQLPLRDVGLVNCCLHWVNFWLLFYIITLLRIWLFIPRYV